MPDGTPDVKASISSSAQDYDFLMGRHTVHHKKRKERFNNCDEWVDIQASKETEKILAGMGNIEKHHLSDFEGKAVEAIALRLFNPGTKLWSLYWADSLNATLDPPLAGSFDGTLGVFFGKDVFQGKDILVQFQYDRSDPANPVWGQAFSNDNGLTWEWNWFMFFKKC